MELKVVGAGLGRTGTASLKLALDKLLGAPCYHMMEVFKHPEHVPMWHSAALGNMPDWNTLFDGYAAAVDWPASAFWPELAAAYPNALILHSVRDSESWWRSASNTIFADLGSVPSPEWLAMVEALFDARFVCDIKDAEACKAAFDRHNAHVRETAPKGRLLEWRAGDGWEPICAALNLPVPDDPFPHVNTSEDWAARRAASKAAGE